MKNAGRVRARAGKDAPEVNAFFDRFLWACELRGIGPWRLAALLDTSPGTVHAWFARTKTPELRWLVRLPGVLGVDGHWLLTGRGDPFRKT